MAMKVTRVDMWAASIKDRPGGLAEKLAILTEAGANVAFALARRVKGKRGEGVVFLSSLKGPKQLRAAKKTGFAKTKSLHAVRVEGADKPGLGTKMTQSLGEAGVNLRGLSASVIGKKFICHLAFDNSADVAKAMRILKKI